MPTENLEHDEMAISLSPDIERLVTDKVSSGAYDSPGDVLREALRLLDARDAEKLDSLRRDLASSAEQFATGDFTSFSTAAELGAQIKSQGRQRAAGRSSDPV